MGEESHRIARGGCSVLNMPGGGSGGGGGVFGCGCGRPRGGIPRGGSSLTLSASITELTRRSFSICAWNSESAERLIRHCTATLATLGWSPTSLASAGAAFASLRPGQFAGSAATWSTCVTATMRTCVRESDNANTCSRAAGVEGSGGKGVFLRRATRSTREASRLRERES